MNSQTNVAIHSTKPFYLKYCLVPTADRHIPIVLFINSILSLLLVLMLCNNILAVIFRYRIILHSEQLVGILGVNFLSVIENKFSCNRFNVASSLQ